MLSVKVSDGGGGFGLPTQKLPCPKCLRGVELRNGALVSDFIFAKVATVSFSRERKVNKLKDEHG